MRLRQYRFHIYAEVIENFAHCFLSHVPLLCRAFIFSGIVGIPLRETEGALIKHADCAEKIFAKAQTTLEFLFKLVGAKNKVSL